MPLVMPLNPEKPIKNDPPDFPHFETKQLLPSMNRN